MARSLVRNFKEKINLGRELFPCAYELMEQKLTLDNLVEQFPDVYEKIKPELMSNLSLADVLICSIGGILELGLPRYYKTAKYFLNIKRERESTYIQ
jgi:hypothetical protein